MNTKKILMALCMVTVILVSGSMAWADVFSVTPEADSYVRNDVPDGNYGADDAVTGRYAGSWSAKAYVRFDISSLIGEDEDVESASLSFVLTEAVGYLTSTQYSLDVYALLDGDVGENWDESTITWNNAPGNDTISPTAMDPARTSGVGYLRHSSTSYAPGDVVTVQLPNYLVDVLSADTDGKVTFILTGRVWSGYGRSYASMENATYAAPTLDFTVVPEPMTMGLLGMGGLGVLLRKRK